MSAHSDEVVHKGLGEAGKLLLGTGAVGSTHHISALSQLLQLWSQNTFFFFLSYLLCVTLSTEVSAGCLNTLLALEFFHRGSDKVGEPLARSADWRAS